MFEKYCRLQSRMHWYLKVWVLRCHNMSVSGTLTDRLRQLDLALLGQQYRCQRRRLPQDENHPNLSS